MIIDQGPWRIGHAYYAKAAWAASKNFQAWVKVDLTMLRSLQIQSFTSKEDTFQSSGLIYEWIV